MKIKVIKAPEGAWYEYLVGKEVGVAWQPLDFLRTDPKGHFVAKTHEWYWKGSIGPNEDQWGWNTDLKMIPYEDCEVVDSSGSIFDDGFELGKLHGKEEKLQELIAEGVVEDESYEEDVDSCCNNEDRSLEGGCKNCGDPAI